MKRLALILWILLVGAVQAEPKDAVVCVVSHGGSGTVIATGPGCTWILSCAHMFEGRDRNKPIVLLVPVPVKSGDPKKGCVVIAVDARRDLSLLRYNDGPFPFVSPVAAAGFHAGPCLSVGYDELKIPAQCRPATILESQGTVTFTRERPWHGRSGGGLIDRKTGSLVGVVSAYTGPSNHRELCPGEKGVYVRHESVLAFLAEIGRGQGFEQQERRPEISYQREYAQPEPWAPRPQIFEQRQFAPQQFPGFAPGGSCPPGRP